MIDAFLQFIRQQFDLHRQTKILLTVSGGLDSTVMAHLFKAAEFSFGIAHCNFQLRGTESDNDAEFVKQMAKSWEVPFFTIQFNTKTYAAEHKLSIEEAARNLRYNWFETIRQTFGYDYIATAHHLDDSLETTLLNFIKGTGIKGLQGIPLRNGRIIRPLLFATKSELSSFADNNSIIYRTDASNASNMFTRNKIRNTIIPLLKEINPALQSTFAQTNKNIIEAARITEKFTASKLKKLAIEKAGNIYIPIAALRNMPYATTLLYTLLIAKNFSADQVLQIASNLHGSGKIFLSKTNRVIIDRKFLIVSSLKEEIAPIHFILSETKLLHAGNCKFEIEAIRNVKKIFTPELHTAYFNLAKITFPITVRKWRKGDYIYPAGMYKANGNAARKKISDLFTDAKYDLLQKEEAWVFECNNKIIWIAGLRQDARFISTGSANAELLKIKMLLNKKSISVN